MFQKSEMRKDQSRKLIRQAGRMNISDRQGLIIGWKYAVRLNGKVFENYISGKAYLDSLQEALT